MKKIILLLIGILLLVSFVNADLVFKQNDQVDLKVPCLSNNTYCAASTLCNISIFYPNQSILINNQKMNNQTAFYNFTVSQNQLNSLGNYQSQVVCNGANDNGFSTFNFKVTKTGGDNANYQSSLILSIVGLIVFLTLIFVIKEDFVRIILTVPTLLMVLGIINIISLITIDPILSKAIDIIYKVVFWVLITLIIFMAYQFIKNWFAKPVDEDEEDEED